MNPSHDHDHDPVYERLSILVQTKYPGRLFTPEDDLFETLAIDSLQALELLTDLEQAFGTEVPDYELQGISTFRGLADVIRGRI